jgi:hypothetical protein
LRLVLIWYADRFETLDELGLLSAQVERHVEE